MSSRMRSLPGSGLSSRTLKAAVSLVALSAVAGCSADVTRFDAPIFGYDGKPTSALRPSEGMLGGNAQRLADEPPPAAGGAYGGYGAVPDYAPGYRPTYDQGAPIDRGIATARLDAPRDAYRADSASERIRQPEPAREPSYRVAAAPAAAPPATPPAAAGSDDILVQPGDTLYSIARKHGVTVAALTSANSLSGTVIRPGQRLVLPGRETVRMAPPSAAPARLPSRVAAPVERPSVSAETGGESYTIRPGDSLYAISRKTRVSVAELKRINGISDPRRLRPGMSLRLRGEAPSSPPATVAAAAPPAQPASRPVRTQRIEVQTKPVDTRQDGGMVALPGVTSRPTILNDSRRRVASLNEPEVKSDAARVPPITPTMDQSRPQAVAVATPSREPVGDLNAGTGFRWPVRGKIITGFGKRPDGTHNDGINIAVPPGTDVHAVEAGVVAYAGSELKGYGNLILIRHDDGWVSAYAHNDQILVKRGDKVTRGQVISKSGKTGSVDQPQLHFELRQGSKPVDPLAHLAKG